jgi:hypothetical protein
VGMLSKGSFRSSILFAQTLRCQFNVNRRHGGAHVARGEGAREMVWSRCDGNTQEKARSSAPSP